MNDDIVGRSSEVVPAVPPDPLFILSAPRSFTSIACAMLGEHPQMYGLPETGLFTVPTMKLWLDGPRHAGLLRCVAEVFFGEQTEESIVRASGWLRRRRSMPTVAVFEQIATRLAPRMVIEKTPAMASSLEILQRTAQMYPGGRYLHLLRHPRGHGRSVMNHMLELAADKNEPPPRWLLAA